MKNFASLKLIKLPIILKKTYKFAYVHFDYLRPPQIAWFVCVNFIKI